MITYIHLLSNIHPIPPQEEKYLPADDQLRQAFFLNALQRAAQEAQMRSRSRISELKKELLGSSQQPLSFDRFYEWALRNMQSRSPRILKRRTYRVEVTDI